MIIYSGTHLRVYACQLEHAKDLKALPECETEDEKDQTNIITAKISMNEIFKIYNKSGLTTTSSDTIATVNQENSQSSVNNTKIFQMKLQIIVRTLKMILARVLI